MRNKLLIGFIFFVVLATQFACSPIRQTVNIRNQVLWRWNKIENYKMTVKIQKTGHATPNGTFIITVRDRIAKSIRPIDKPALEMLDTEIRFTGYDTMEGVFRYIENAECGKCEIEYDWTLGYPKKVDLDQPGVFDDELRFEVLEFEAIDSSDSEPAAKSSPRKLNSVLATEITKVEFSTRSHFRPLVGSDESYMTSSAASFLNDGTALNSPVEKRYDTGKKQGFVGQKYQGVISTEQFQKLAQTLVNNNFSNLEDSTERITDSTDYDMTVSYAGKTKTIIPFRLIKQY